MKYLVAMETRRAESLRDENQGLSPSTSESLYAPSFIRSNTQDEHRERQTWAVLSQLSISMGLPVGDTNYSLECRRAKLLEIGGRNIHCLKYNSNIVTRQ